MWHTYVRRGRVNDDLFYKVVGSSPVVYGLRDRCKDVMESEALAESCANDIVTPAKRGEAKVNRIIRDTVIVRELKTVYENCCQLCNQTLMLHGEESYSEGHHLKPLGKPHNGPDAKTNILILCPNCHVLFDYLVADVENVELFKGNHKLDRDYVDYYKKLQISKK